MCLILVIFFFNDTATTEIYTLSLHDALPISVGVWVSRKRKACSAKRKAGCGRPFARCALRLKATHSRSPPRRSEEHTSELQSQSNLVCRLLLEKKKQQQPDIAQPLGLLSHTV